MTKVGKGRPDPKVRMGRMMKVLENSPGNPFFNNFNRQSMTFEDFQRIADRLNKMERNKLKGTVSEREINFFRKLMK